MHNSRAQQVHSALASTYQGTPPVHLQRRTTFTHLRVARHSADGPAKISLLTHAVTHASKGKHQKFFQYTERKALTVQLIGALEVALRILQVELGRLLRDVQACRGTEKLVIRQRLRWDLADRRSQTCDHQRAG